MVICLPTISFAYLVHELRSHALQTSKSLFSAIQLFLFLLYLRVHVSLISFELLTLFPACTCKNVRACVCECCQERARKYLYGSCFNYCHSGGGWMKNQPHIFHRLFGTVDEFPYAPLDIRLFPWPLCRVVRKKDFEMKFMKHCMREIYLFKSPHSLF